MLPACRQPQGSGLSIPASGRQDPVIPFPGSGLPAPDSLIPTHKTACIHFLYTF